MNIVIRSPSLKVRKVQYNFSGSGTEPPHGGPAPVNKPKKPKKPKKKTKYNA